MRNKYLAAVLLSLLAPACAAAGGGFCVYDFYGVLAGGDGFLKPEY